MVSRAVVNRSISKTLQSSTLQTAVELAVHKCLAEPHVINDVVIRTIDLRALTVSVTRFVKNKVERRFLEKAKVDGYRNLSNKATVGHNTKAEGDYPLQKMEMTRSPGPLKVISDDRKTNPKAYSKLSSSPESDICRHNLRRQERSSKPHRSRQHYPFPVHPVRRPEFSESGLKVLVLVNERYPKTVDYGSYRSMYKSQRNDDDLASETQKMHKNVGIQMKDPAFNKKNSISVINYFT